jgi:hypothetical protein
MTSHRAINLAVSEALGIDIKQVVGVDIKMRPGDFPRVQITRLLTGNHYAKTRQQFELRAIGPAEPTPLDPGRPVRQGHEACTQDDRAQRRKAPAPDVGAQPH